MATDLITASVYFTISLHSCLGLLLYLIFEFLKYQQDDIYQPKYYKNQNHLPKLSKVPFVWIYQILNHISDEQVLNVIGIDGYMLLRSLRCLTMITLSISFLSLTILMPIYQSTNSSITNVIGINTLTMANITSNSNLLWYCCLFNWFFVIIFLSLYHYEYSKYMDMKINHNSYNKDNFISKSQLCTIIIENIPNEYQNTLKLFQLFHNYFPNQILSCCIALNVNSNIKKSIINKRLSYLTNLESSIMLYEKSEKKNIPYILINNNDNKLYDRICKDEYVKMNSIEYYYQKLIKYNHKYQQLILSIEEIQNLQGNENNSQINNPNNYLNSVNNHENLIYQNINNNKYIVNSLITLTSTGFLTLKSRYLCLLACQWDKLDYHYPTMKIKHAPHPNDIIWYNIKYNSIYIRYTSNCMKIFYYMNIFFWGGIISFIVAISSLSNLEKLIPALNNINRNTYIFLQGQLSVWALLSLMILLPYGIRYISIYIERHRTYSSIDYKVFYWYYYFQMINVIYTVLAGTTYNILDQAIKDPLSIISLIAQSLPTVSVIFINLLITMLFSGISLELLRPIPSISYLFYTKVMNEKNIVIRNILEGPLAKEYIDYSRIYTQILYILCISLTYWIIAPLVMIIASLWFLSYYILYKYKLCYVLYKRYEKEGLYWNDIYRKSMTLLIVTTLLNIGYMGIKQGTMQVSLLTPLPFVIYLIWSYTENKFKNMSDHQSYQFAKESEFLCGINNQPINHQSTVSISSSIEGIISNEEILSNTERQHYQHSCNIESMKLPINSSINCICNSSTSYYPILHEYQNKYLQEPLTSLPYIYRMNNIPLFNNNYCTKILNPIYYDPMKLALDDISDLFLNQNVIIP